jgi:hypothetical protein
MVMGSNPSTKRSNVFTFSLNSFADFKISNSEEEARNRAYTILFSFKKNREES